MIDERAQILPWLAQAKERELELRKKIVSALFPDPVEGTNRLFTEDGFEVYMKYTINRKLDEAALPAVMQQLPEDSNARVLDVLITYKPQLVLSGFRELPEDQAKIFAQALTEEPGTPQLEIQKIETPVMDKYEEGKISKSEVTQRMRDVADAHKKPKPAKAKKGKK